jgi:hypothetical protein
MRPELSRRLSKAGATVEEVQRIVDFCKYPDDPRTVLVRGLLAMIVQHHRSILLLIKRGIVHSAYALARDVIRGTRYGLWINACATSGQILSIHEEDYSALSIPEMNKEVEAAYQRDPFFAELKGRWAAKVDRYSREIIVRVGQFYINPESGLEQEDEEVEDVVTIATLCIVLLASKFLATQKHAVESKQVEVLAAAYSS